MAIVAPHTFRLEVWQGGKLVKELINDSGKVPFGVIQDFASVLDIREGLTKDVSSEALGELQEILNPIMRRMFADFEEGDLDGIDLVDLIGFIGDFSGYIGDRFGGGKVTAQPKNRQTVAPKKR